MTARKAYSLQKLGPTEFDESVHFGLAVCRAHIGEPAIGDVDELFWLRLQLVYREWVGLLPLSAFGGGGI